LSHKARWFSTLLLIVLLVVGGCNINFSVFYITSQLLIIGSLMILHVQTFRNYVFKSEYEYGINESGIIITNLKNSNKYSFPSDFIEKIEYSSFWYQNIPVEFVTLKFKNTEKVFRIEEEPLNTEQMRDFQRFKELLKVKSEK